MKGVMKTAIFAIGCTLMAILPAFAQARSSLVAKAFSLLGESKILNAIMIYDWSNPAIVVMSLNGSKERLTLFSLAKGEVHVTWMLEPLPQFMAVAGPEHLEVVQTDTGPIITLHGCAAHLCGGQGLAGALAYDINDHRLYTAYASYNAPVVGKTTFVYSPEFSGSHHGEIKKLLDDMLRAEHYTP
jgi:hypothetical protein